MHTLVNAQLACGMILVPVGVSSRASRKESKFRLLHKDCGSTVKMPKWCPVHEKQLEDHEIEHGFEYAKDKFVVIDEEELAKFAVERDKEIRLTKFVPSIEVEGWIEKSYYLAPNKLALNQYLLLWNAMRKSGLAGVGTASLWGRESPCAAVATEDGIIFSSLFCYDEMRSAGEIREMLQAETVTAEQKLADQLVSALSDKLDPMDDLVSASRERVEEFINAKIEGKKPEPQVGYDAPEPQIDLTKALRDSIAEAKQAKKDRKKVTA